MTALHHRRLDCGIDFAAEVMPDRPTVSLSMRFRSGAAYEPEDKLGVARLVEETVSKGTSRRDGRGLLDALDARGIRHSSGTGRETITFRFTCLPEFIDEALDLHAEMLTTPTFPPEACDVAVDLALQEIKALEDEPRELVQKFSAARAYGPRLGRDPLGEEPTVQSIGRQDILDYWSQQLGANRMQASAAGDLDVDRLVDKLESLFGGFGPCADDARESVPLAFEAGTTHHPKDQEQDYMILCWPGVPRGHADEATERVMIGILSGGMSGRLFTEVREKQGLVYWVGAWAVRPRGSGMIHVGASTMPDRCDKTYATLLREIDRLGEDLTEDELRRAITGIVARKQTEGDLTRSRASDIGDDLHHFGRPIPVEERLAAIQTVTVDDIRRYLDEHPRDALNVTTLGPKDLTPSTRR